MAEILEVMIMFIKVMFCGAGAIISVMVFSVVAYLAAIVIKSALQAVLQGAEEHIKRQQEKQKEEKQKGKKKHE